MCSRFELNNTAAELARQFELPEPPPMPNKAEFRPTDRVLTITARSGSDEGHTNLLGKLLAWGIPAPWDGKPIFNARCETLWEKPTFKPYLNGRCIVPASAYFEWRADGSSKTKMRIAPTCAGDRPLAFAALGNNDHVTIVTCAASPTVKPIHGRMPVLLDRDTIRDWLNPALSQAQAAALLVPHELNGLTIEEVPSDTSARRLKPPSMPEQPDLFSS